MLKVFAGVQREQQVGEEMKVEAMKPVWSTPSQAADLPVILLVEDESIVREVTGAVLKHAGYEVLETAGVHDKQLLRLRRPGARRREGSRSSLRPG